MSANTDIDNPPPLLRALPTFAGAGIGRTQAYRLMKANTPPGVKVGRSTYIRREDWKAFIANLPEYRATGVDSGKAA